MTSEKLSPGPRSALSLASTSGGSQIRRSPFSLLCAIADAPDRHSLGDGVKCGLADGDPDHAPNMQAASGGRQIAAEIFRRGIVLATAICRPLLFTLLV
jgi:hypothetical protein